MKRLSEYMRGRQNKPRKILKLEERVQAIRLYELEPVYQRVATALDCSWEQIKNVITNRRSILQNYVDCQSIRSGEEHDERLVRDKKINFLGNVMFEYIKRAHYHRSAPLNDNAIIERALEFSDLLQIAKFYPNRDWLGDFKKTCDIDFDYMANILMIQPPEATLLCEDIISHCKKELDKDWILAYKQEDGRRSMCQVAESSSHGTVSRDGDDVIEIDDDVVCIDDEEGLTIDFGHYEADVHATSPISDKSPTNDVAHAAKADSRNETVMGLYTTKSAKIKTATAPITPKYSADEVGDYMQALKLLRPLEDFALSEEDFRAINLLAQLAEHYATRKAAFTLKEN